MANGKNGNEKKKNSKCILNFKRGSDGIKNYEMRKLSKPA